MVVILAAPLLVTGISLDQYYYSTSPRTQDPATGRVYPLTVHGGTLVYLTYGEMLPLQYGWIPCIAMLPVGAYLSRKQRNREKLSEESQGA